MRNGDWRRVVTRRAGWWAGRALVAGAAALVAGCTSLDDLLEVDVPGEVLSESLAGPGKAALLVAGAVADFECALGRYIVGQGAIGEELIDSNLSGTSLPVDRRDLGDAGGILVDTTCDLGQQRLPGMYTPLQIARAQGDRAAARLEAHGDAEVPNRQSLLATAYAYAGYSVLLLAESHCSIAIDLGPELQRAQAFAEAESRFTRAIAAAQAAGNTALLNMARVGRARTRLNLAVQGGRVVAAAKLAEAGADAALVPEGFVRNATFDATPARRNNGVFYSVNFEEAYAVQDRFWNVTDMGTVDPRVRVANQRRVSNSDRLTPFWTQTKYPAINSPIPIARYAEAQLIVAEAQGGQAAVDIINRLHAAAGLPRFPGGSAEVIRQHVIEERARELFLEGHHLGDKLRYGLPFTPAVGTPYPKGGVYGDMTCVPLPRRERENNPNIG